MARTLYGFGQGSSGCHGATQQAPPLDPPNGHKVYVHAAGRNLRSVVCKDILGPYPTREEAAIVARHVMDQSWCVALVEGAN